MFFSGERLKVILFVPTNKPFRLVVSEETIFIQ